MANEKPKRRSPTTADDRSGTRARIVDEICKAIATGKSIRSLLADDVRPPHWPGQTQFWHWQFDDPTLRAGLEAALRVRAVVHAEEITDLAAEKPPMVDTQFGQHVDNGFVAWKKMQIEARQWCAARMAPKLYGDKLTVAGDAKNPLTVSSAREAKAVLLGRLGALNGAGRNPAPGGEIKR